MQQWALAELQARQDSMAILNKIIVDKTKSIDSLYEFLPKAKPLEKAAIRRQISNARSIVSNAVSALDAPSRSTVFYTSDVWVKDEAGKPIEGVLVYPDGEMSDRTNYDGLVTLRNLVAGKFYYLTFTKPGYERAHKYLSGSSRSEPLTVTLVKSSNPAL